MQRHSVIKTLFLFIYLLLMLHVGAELFYWYWIFPWFDLLTHFLGGVCIGVGVLWLFFMSGYIAPRTWSARSGLIHTLVGVGIIGVGWEVYEIAVHLLLQTPFESGYALDTAGDITMDTLGALSAYVGFAWRAKRKGVAERNATRYA